MKKFLFLSFSAISLAVSAERVELHGFVFDETPYDRLLTWTDPDGSLWYAVENHDYECFVLSTPEPGEDGNLKLMLTAYRGSTLDQLFPIEGATVRSFTFTVKPDCSSMSGWIESAYANDHYFGLGHNIGELAFSSKERKVNAKNPMGGVFDMIEFACEKPEDMDPDKNTTHGSASVKKHPKEYDPRWGQLI